MSNFYFFTFSSFFCALHILYKCWVPEYLVQSAGVTGFALTLSSWVLRAIEIVVRWSSHRQSQGPYPFLSHPWAISSKDGASLFYLNFIFYLSFSLNSFFVMVYPILFSIISLLFYSYSSWTTWQITYFSFISNFFSWFVSNFLLSFFWLPFIFVLVSCFHLPFSWNFFFGMIFSNLIFSN